jgi:hypothetical protein
VLESTVSKRLYFWVLLFTLPILLGSGWAILYRDNDIWPLFTITLIFLMSLMFVFSSMRLSACPKAIRYQSIFRKIETNVNDLHCFGVRTIPMPKTAGKPVFYFTEKDGREHLIPINMFKEDGVKEMAQHLKNKGINLISDEKIMSKKSIGNFYE